MPSFFTKKDILINRKVKNMTLKLVLDRFEDNIAICLDEDNRLHLIPQSTLNGIRINDIFSIELENDIYHSPNLLVEETAKKKEEISQRMKKLFKMTQHRRPPKV